jgi:hypothetical protein
MKMIKASRCILGKGAFSLHLSMSPQISLFELVYQEPVANQVFINEDDQSIFLLDL